VGNVAIGFDELLDNSDLICIEIEYAQLSISIWKVIQIYEPFSIEIKWNSAVIELEFVVFFSFIMFN